MLQKDKITGLTGGSGSGKSTAADELRLLGAVVIDADKIGHDIILKGHPAYDDIVKYFGEEILLPDGEINRKALGKIVFSDPDKLNKLNNMTHPRITDEIRRIISENPDREIVIDAAVLLDCEGIKNLCGKVIVVCADTDMRINRISSRDSISPEAAKARIFAQRSDAELTAFADIVWHNNGSESEFRRTVRDSWNK